MKKILLSLTISLSAICSIGAQTLDTDKQLAYCHQQVGKALKSLQPYDYNMMPRNILKGQTRWNCRKAKAQEWCSGFWSGILWMDYGCMQGAGSKEKEAGRKEIRKAAEGYTQAMTFLEKEPVFDHDLGFLVINSFLKGYEQTGNDEYKRIALVAADSLTTIFNAKVETVSGLDPDKFDSVINGKPVKLYTLRNTNGMEACITNYGGRVVSLVVPDKNGKPTDVVLGFDNIAQYADTLNSPTDYGSSVGRYANRIQNGTFILNKKTYRLRQNDGTNCLHGGGNTGWMNKPYDAKQIGDSILQLTINAEDGENGFPGKVTAITTYKLTDDNTFDITWEATTNKPTIINQTNHNYYNLSGDFTQPMYDMILYVNADNFTPSDKTYIPTGEIKAVEGTPMDFRTPHAIGDSIRSQYDQIQNATGYDHNFCLNTYKDGCGDDSQVCASLYSPKSGIFMEMYTNEPGLQVYSGNFQGVGREADITRKHGLKYPQHVSVCLESQKFPDSPNHKEWAQPTLKPGETYHSHAAYKFSIK